MRRMDDTLPADLEGACRSRPFMFMLAALSFMAVACATSPPDGARISSLSSEEVVALCDELRDAVRLADHPVECQESQIQWLLPTNQSCREAALAACGATAGDVRSWHELARRDPCSVGATNLLAAFPDPAQQGCEALRPQVIGIDVPCATTGLASLERFDGVYELTSLQVLAAGGCEWTMPAVLDPSLPHFVVVSTQASGVPELILKSCGAVAECQALAREIRVLGDPEGRQPEGYRYDHFALCEDAFIAQSRAPDGVACQHQWRPRAELMMLVDEMMLSDAEVRLILRSGPSTAPESPGCGYVVLPSASELDACFSLSVHQATRVALP